ncbi:MAG: UDP-N-acetyl-D-glucosamine dehydrogenase [Deltaproteobacteria bacterium]|jgi:UDP-N-acetyl-D-glucosamine dehydrogenase|nr:UDP-N-acetyl-D-glucosamine dehydrogenase [Deltaproteobacteria bacterium]
MSKLEALHGRIETRDAHIGVIGLGYVGLPLVVELGNAGFHVTGFDVDTTKVRAIAEGRSYIGDVPSSDVATLVEKGRFDATSDFDTLADVDVINICVPTPLRKTRDPDVSFIASAVEEIRRHLREGQLIILGSTTYPGTTHEFVIPMLEGAGLEIGRDFSLAFAPERIDPGNTKFKVKDVPKVVGGETPLCTRLACAIFDTIFEQTIPVTSTQAAEMVKLLENTFRAINIGLANEIALMCEKLDLDVWEVIEAAATKPYGFMKFTPGPGLGGHCIPVDPVYLSWKMKSLNFPARFIELATEVNSGMPDHVVDRIAEMLNEDRLAVNGARILILGIAYKPGVDDMRESPALDVIAGLCGRGGDIRYHDPFVAECEIAGEPMKSVDLTDEELKTSDLVVILTDHPNVDYGRVVRVGPRVFDTRNATVGVENDREKITKL